MPKAKGVLCRALDHPHLFLAVVSTGSGGDVRELLDLFGTQQNGVSGRVLFDAGDPLGSGNRGDVVALREHPGKGDLSRSGPDLRSDRLDVVNGTKVALEILADETRVGLARIAFCEVLGGTDLLR